MSRKLKQMIEWFLKDTPDDAELDLTNLQCNPIMVKNELQNLGYNTKGKLFHEIDNPNHKSYLYLIIFNSKFNESFSLTVESNIETFKIKLIKEGNNYEKKQNQ